jgi:hypothetical protein
MATIPALWREKSTDDWRDCELLVRHRSGALVLVRHRSGALVLHEVGKLWPGIWTAPADAVCVPASQAFLQLKAA